MSKNFYPEVSSNQSFPELETEILKFWQDNNIFQKSIDNRPAEANGENNEFIFYDGPPFANGLPHYGHLLTGFIKDLVARYQTIKGHKVERRFGWDCHGLPAEMAAEKELKISGRKQITDYGIDKFNAHCQTSVMKFTEEWQDYVTRQARWVDFNNDYKTMDKNFMESVIWAFKSLYEKGLVYQSMRVMPYSWACQTPLSNFETRLDNSYRERADKAITVSFALKEKPTQLAEADFYKVLAWTTTPWTLPSNLALAIGEDIQYVAVKKDNGYYILAEFALATYKKELNIDDDSEIIKLSAADLAGLEYTPILNYFANHPNAFKILKAEFVVEGDGTGIVHIAPGFGEDDQLLCQQHDIELVCPVDDAGCFTNEVIEFAGQNVFDTIDPIIIKLKQQNSWLKTDQYLHNYPHCWRTDTPLIYKAVPSWYVEVTKIKERMVELNQNINWLPGHVKDGLFGKWLENARDWSVSRNRFWGTPIPVWQSDDPKYPRIDVYGSIEELKADFGVEVKDLHRPYIDELTRPNPDDPTGKSTMRRVTDVFDCWFESGSMPFAQVHYPFENKDWFEDHFPADFIVEYTAQTRGWFYTLMVLGTALFDKYPFKNCICHGVILDATGQKLSKRLNNYADPKDIFNNYGADALRYTMLSSTVAKGSELLIDKEGNMIKDSIRLYIKPIWNAYHFFTLYANADNLQGEVSFDSNNVIDQYILAKLKTAIMNIDNSLSNYDLQQAYQQLSSFFEVLNNWYIRRSRARFWQTEINDDKKSAYNTLFTCLNLMMRAASPLIPLLSEAIYQGLNGHELKAENSVHLQDFANIDAINIDEQLVATMDKIREICSSALFIRNSKNIRVRQPLAELKIVTNDNLQIADFVELIKDEVNVKQVNFADRVNDYADLKLDLNFKILAKRLPAKIKQIIPAVKQGKWQQQGNEIMVSLADEQIAIHEDEFSLSLLPKDKEQTAALPDNNSLIILDLNLSEELLQEGHARDLVRMIQQARKDLDLNISDHINLQIDAENEIVNAAEKFKNYIEEQTLANIVSEVSSAKLVEAIINEQKVKLKISKVA